MEKTKAIIYARVSTAGQDYDRQLAELKQYAARMGYDVVKTFSEKYNTVAKSNRFGTQDKPNKNVIRTWATTQEKSIQRISRPK